MVRSPNLGAIENNNHAFLIAGVYPAMFDIASKIYGITFFKVVFLVAKPHNDFTTDYKNTFLTVMGKTN